MDDLISRQQAIEAFNTNLNELVIGGEENAKTVENYLNRVLDKIKYLPSALGTNLAEVGTDCISRQAAIDRATKEHDFFRGAVTVSDKARRDELLNVMCWLGELPPAQPAPSQIAKDIARILENGQDMRVIGQERIRGRWTRDNACSECGCQPWFSGDIHNYNFCPNCGAKMEATT